MMREKKIKSISFGRCVNRMDSGPISWCLAILFLILDKLRLVYSSVDNLIELSGNCVRIENIIKFKLISRFERPDKICEYLFKNQIQGDGFLSN